MYIRSGKPARALSVFAVLVFLASACHVPAAPASNTDTSALATKKMSKPVSSMAPTPYTAEEIRLACPEGRQDTFRVEEGTDEAVLRQMTFLRHTEDGAVVRSELVDVEGVTLGKAQESSATWDDFRRHAEYPAGGTTVTNAKITTPAGDFEARYYVIEGADEADDGQVTHAWFADDLPGPPVLMEIRVNDTTVFRMELVSHLITTVD